MPAYRKMQSVIEYIGYNKEKYVTYTTNHIFWLMIFFLAGR